MAIEPTITAYAEWNAALAERTHIIHNLDTNPDHSRHLDDRLAAVEDQLLELASPDITGVILKLRLLWAEQLHGHDDESRHKLLVLDDLRRLTPA